MYHEFVLAKTMEFLFLSLSVELQHMVVSHITRPTDLKALCHTSKQMSALATPVLFYTVDLRPHYRTVEQVLARINSLLLNEEKKLRHIRILKTNECDWWMTKALDLLLPKLMDDRLISFEYSDLGGDLFPTTRQMEYMWTHQRKIQNLRSTYIAPQLVAYLRKNHLQPRDLLRNVNSLVIREENRDIYSAESINWPLDNLDISLLRTLTISGWSFAQHQEKLNFMFSRHAFQNLTHMRFIDVIFNSKLDLRNCPSLVTLAIICCHNVASAEAGVFIPEPLPLKSLLFDCEEEVEDVAQILFQIQGLSQLTILMRAPEEMTKETDEQRKGMAVAIASQMETLVDLVLDETPSQDGELFFDASFLGIIARCKKLCRLGLQLASRSQVPSYSRLIRLLPRLTYFWIADPGGHCGDSAEDVADKIKERIPSSSRLTFFAFANIRYVRREMHPEYDEATQTELEPEMVAVATEMTWNTALAYFYGKYP